MSTICTFKYINREIKLPRLREVLVSVKVLRFSINFIILNRIRVFFFFFFENSGLLLPNRQS